MGLSWLTRNLSFTEMFAEYGLKSMVSICQNETNILLKKVFLAYSLKMTKANVFILSNQHLHRLAGGLSIRVYVQRQLTLHNSYNRGRKRKTRGGNREGHRQGLLCWNAKKKLNMLRNCWDTELLQKQLEVKLLYEWLIKTNLCFQGFKLDKRSMAALPYTCKPHVLA